MEITDLFDIGRIPSRQPFVHGSHNLNGQIEWYTPSEYIDAARSVMGTIHIDPCTSELAQKTVKADSYYTIETDGLSHPWFGTVWLNPPYTAKLITQFVDKLLGHMSNGEVSEAILLTHNNADTKWFHKAAMQSKSVCFTRGRVRFYDEHGISNSPTHGHVFMYFGPRKTRFEKSFRKYGWICRGVK